MVTRSVPPEIVVAPLYVLPPFESVTFPPATVIPPVPVIVPGESVVGDEAKRSAIEDDCTRAGDAADRLRRIVEGGGAIDRERDVVVQRPGLATKSAPFVASFSVGVFSVPLTLNEPPLMFTAVLEV